MAATRRDGGADRTAPAARDIEYVPCDLCGADDTRVLYGARDHRLGVDTRTWVAVRCRRCGLGYLNPRPTPEVIGRYYAADYYGGRAPDGELRARYELQASYLDGLTPGRLVDIGCANGDWISIVQGRGWDVQGLEFSAQSAPRQDVPIVVSPFPDSVLEAGAFDVVTAWAVFEHLHRPRAAFARAAALLRPGGRLLLLVPNLRSVASRWAYMEDIPRHLYFFTEPTLAAYGDGAGLDLARVDHHPQFFGGAGRGALRVRAYRALGRTDDEYHRHLRLSRADRRREAPGLAAVSLVVGAAERLLLSDRLARWTRTSGHVVAVFTKR